MQAGTYRGTHFKRRRHTVHFPGSVLLFSIDVEDMNPLPVDTEFSSSSFDARPIQLLGCPT